MIARSSGLSVRLLAHDSLPARHASLAGMRHVLARVAVREHHKTPPNKPLRQLVLVMILWWERVGLIGADLPTAPGASINAGVGDNLTRAMLPVELSGSILN